MFLFRKFCVSAGCVRKKNFFFKLVQKILVFMFTFELICMLLEGYIKFFTLSGFFWLLKNIEIFGFFAHTQPAQAIFQRTLSLRRQFFSAGSAGVGKLLAKAQPA